VPEVTEFELPGFGVRYEFTTADDRQLGVIVHKSGQRDLLVYDEADPDRCTETIVLDQESTQLLTELLGGTTVTRRLGEMQQEIEGLVIEWIHLEPGDPALDRSIGELEIRTRTGVSIVAIVHDDHAQPAPGPDQALHSDDVIVAVGTKAGIEQVRTLLRG